MILRLPASLLAVIEESCRAAFPAEACGLLVGHGRRVLQVTKAVPAANLVTGRTDRFELDPAARFAVERDCRGGPDRVIGHWHSHPEAEPVPSPTDLAMVWEPELLWLIVGTHADGTTAPRAWKPAADGSAFQPVTLEVATARRGQKTPCNRPPIPT